MSVWHVTLYDTIDTPVNTPPHTRLLERLLPYNRLWALAFQREPTIKTATFICRGEVNIVTEKCLDKVCNYLASRHASDGSSRTSPVQSERLQLLTIVIEHLVTVWVRPLSPSPSSMGRTIHNGQPRWLYFLSRSNCGVSSNDNMTCRKSQQQKWPLQRRQLSKTGWIAMVLPDQLSCWAWSIVYTRNTRRSRMRRCFGRRLYQPTDQSGSSTSSRLRKTFGASRYRTAGMSPTVQRRINRTQKDYNLCSGPSTTDTDVTVSDTANTIAKMSEQERIFYLLRWIAWNDKWKVFLELIMNKTPQCPPPPEDIMSKLVEMEAAVKRVNELAPDALLFAKKGGKGGSGGNGGRGGKGDKSPKRDKRYNKDDRKEEDLGKCFHCQQQRYITENCFSKQRGDLPMAANTAAKASTDITSTRTTSIENYWMLVSSKASSSDWFIDCRCRTNISGRWTMFIIYTKYPPNKKMVKGNNEVISFPLDMEVLSWFVNYQMERQKRLYSKK